MPGRIVIARGLARAWSDERTLHRSERALVVDKPAGVPCGDGAGNAPGADLRARLLRHGLGALEARFAPPERASGITLLGSGPDQPEPGRVPRRLGYVLGVDAWRLPAQGRLPAPGAIKTDAIVYRVARRRGQRALVEVEGSALPADVLSAFAREGQAVVGDTGADAPASTRLLLHVSSITSPVRAVAPLPSEFESWLDGAPVRSPGKFAEALLDAALPRYELWSEYEAFPLLSEAAGEIAGLSIERYGEYAVISTSSDEAWELRERVAECLMDLGARGVYVKRRVRADLRGADVDELAPSAPLRGMAAPAALHVRQGPLAFWVELSAGLATGLFLDQRGSWLRLHREASGARVLNLFSYTGAFSVAAAAGGAAHTTSVDLSARALSRLRDNLALGGLSGDRHRLLKSDVPRWLARANRAGQCFDWIVLDPPSFGTRGRGVLSTLRDYAGLVRGAASLLEPGGRLLCVSHHRKISQSELSDICSRELEGARLEPIVGGWDAPTLPGVSVIQGVLATRV